MDEKDLEIEELKVELKELEQEFEELKHENEALRAVLKPFLETVSSADIRYFETKYEIEL